MKIGKEKRHGERQRAHLGSNPDLRVIVRYPGYTEEETRAHRTLRPHRVPRTKEWFFRTEEVEQWITEKVLEFGETKEGEAKETWYDYLQRVAVDGITPECRNAAAADLVTWHKLIHVVPESAQGGFDLGERLAGFTGLRSGDTMFPELQNEAMSVMTYNHATFVFHVWEEACRFYARGVPLGAVKAGLFPRMFRAPGTTRVGCRRDGQNGSPLPCADQYSLFQELEAQSC